MTLTVPELETTKSSRLPGRTTTLSGPAATGIVATVLNLEKSTAATELLPLFATKPA